MASLYKVILKLGVLVLLLTTSSVDSTWNDAEGGNIPVPTDTFSWHQIGLLTSVFSLLVILWFFGMLPIMVNVPLNRLVEQRSMNEQEDHREGKCMMMCKLMASISSEPKYEGTTFESITSRRGINKSVE